MEPTASRRTATLSVTTSLLPAVRRASVRGSSSLFR